MYLPFGGYWIAHFERNIMKCNCRTWFCLTAALTLSVTAAESTSWDSANNIVTYSDTTRMSLGGTSKTGYLSQFDANTIALQYGGSAGDYTLVKVVLSIDGALSGTVQLTTTDSPSSVDLSLYHLSNPSQNGQGWSRIMIGAHSASESYSYYEQVNLATHSSHTSYIDIAGTGPASSSDIDQDLNAYIGGSKVAAQIDFKGQWSAEGLSNGSTTVDVYGDAVYSVSYYYEIVPEPSSLIFLMIGSLVLATRRKVLPHSSARG